jgi:hypothetical protein
MEQITDSFRTIQQKNNCMLLILATFYELKIFGVSKIRNYIQRIWVKQSLSMTCEILSPSFVKIGVFHARRPWLCSFEFVHFPEAGRS